MTSQTINSPPRRRDTISCLLVVVVNKKKAIADLRKAAKKRCGGVHVLGICSRPGHGGDGGGVDRAGEEKVEVQQVGQLLAGQQTEGNSLATGASRSASSA